jgi:DNA-binding beta-propeller fold protein YncE
MDSVRMDIAALRGLCLNAGAWKSREVFVRSFTRTAWTSCAGILALTGGLVAGGRNTLKAQDAGMSQSAAGKSGYHLIKKVKLGGEGGWDYLTVDPASRRLFISRGTHVMVVDADGGKVVGDIPDTSGVHGIALVPEMNKGFTSNGKTATSTIFDMKTLKILGEAKTDKDPDAIIYDPASKRVFTFNGDASSATAIDAATGKTVGTVALGGGPEFAASDGQGHVFVNLEDKSQLVKFDPVTLKVEKTWPLAPCESPSGLAIDAEHEILVVGCHNKMMAFVDGNSGHVIGTVPIGQGVDANRFDPETGFAFASCGDGTVTVAHEDSPDKFSVVDTITTQRGARTMELDKSNHNLYLVSADFGATPPATPEKPRPRPPIVPDTFTLLIYGR